MTDTSGQHEGAVPEGARPVHPDGAIDAPLDTDAAAHYGGTTGAEHDGGAQQGGAEPEGDAVLDGSSSHGTSEAVPGGTDRVAGAGSPAEGARGGSPVEEKASPVHGLGSSSTGTGSPVQPAESPSEGLGGSSTGVGSPVQDAESPTRGTGPSDLDDEERPDQADPLG